MSETLLPPSATNQERALDLATARVGDVGVPLRTLWDPDTCPAALLPWLAWALNVELWDDAWTEPQKRQSIKDAVAYHRQKGTIGSVRSALQPYGADVVEWFEDEPPSDPYTFIITLAPGTDDTVLAKIIRAATKTKNARSQFAFRSDVAGTYHAGAACVDGDVVIITG